MQKPNETVDQYALNIKCLIKRLRPYLTFRNNTTLKQTIGAARQIESNYQQQSNNQNVFLNKHLNNSFVVNDPLSQLYDNLLKRQKDEGGDMTVDQNLIDVNNSHNQEKKKEARTIPYSLVDDLLHLKTNVTKKQEEKQAMLGKEKPKNTFMICKEQVAGWTINIIIDSGSSTILENDWLRKAKAVIDYNQLKIKVNNSNRTVEILCKNTIQMFIKAEEYLEENKSNNEDYNEDKNKKIKKNLLGISLVVSEKKSSDQHYYKITSKEIQIDFETYS
ncbi:12788_t:CDS:2 [Cetraspora pellucida]|uniref:12788_t:CDS:1 n=1 Tax=Cetraspora pellucida TaxID=1433469 RepID=A0A9N9GQC8_9GLOM|nr:12788_t:CDS:2 [Cetraspora pellucida]